MQLPLILLTRSPSYYTSKRLIDSARARGFATHCLDSGSSEEAAMHQLGGVLGKRPWSGLVIPRIGSRHTASELRLLSALIAQGLRSPSSPEALDVTMDKAATYQRLLNAGLPVVPSYTVESVEAARKASHDLGAGPWVIKPQRGSQGRDVVRASGLTQLMSLCADVLTRNAGVIIQPFVPMAQPRDLRVLVTEGVARAACWRVASPGEFRSNVHLGATTEAAVLTPEIKHLAEAAAHAVGLTHAGVDLLPVRTSAGPQAPSAEALTLLEVNGSPGLEGIERVTQRDLADLVIDDAVSAYARHSRGCGNAPPTSSA